jgi:hypothetical protein
VEQELEKFKAWWTVDKDNYLLLVAPEVSTTIEKSLIYEIKTKRGVMLEDKDLALELKRRMHAAGVPIVSVDDLP